MAFDLPGDATEFDPTVAYEMKAPSNGDALNVESVEDDATTPRTGFQSAADGIEFFRQVFNGSLTVVKALFDGTGNATPPTWNGTAPLVGTSDNAGGANPYTAFGARDTTAGAAQWRIYRGAAGNTWLVRNAYWDAAATLWKADDAATDSGAILMTNGLQHVYVYYKALGTASWALNAWDNGNVVCKDLSASNNIAATAGVTGATVTGGTVAATTTVTAGTNVATTSGSVTAGGTVSGNTGPGLLRGKRLYGTGTALVGGDFTLTGWGAGQAVTSVSGTDMAGHVTWSAAGAVPVADPTIKITFKDGTFTTTPVVLVQLQAAPGFADLILPLIPGTITATDITFTYKTNGAAPTLGNYTMRWIIVGI